MAKKLATFKRPIETVYYYDGRSTLSSRNADFKGHSLTPHGAKRAAYRHLDKDYGDAKKAIITDLRTGLELWNMRVNAKGDIICEEISAKTQLAIKLDIARMIANKQKF